MISDQIGSQTQLSPSVEPVKVRAGPGLTGQPRQLSLDPCQPSGLAWPASQFGLTLSGVKMVAGGAWRRPRMKVYDYNQEFGGNYYQVSQAPGPLV